MKAFQKYLIIPLIFLFISIPCLSPAQAGIAQAGIAQTGAAPAKASPVYASGKKTASVSDYLSVIVLSDYAAVLDIGESFCLMAVSSDLSRVRFKSSNSSVASVSMYGIVTAKKAGTATITARTSKAEAYCTVIVSPTVVTLNRSSASLQNGASVQLTATVSTNSEVKWKSSAKSVASVDENGLVSAHKPGSAIITASADGTKVTCTVKVLRPSLTLSASSLRLYRCRTKRVTVKTSSGLPVKWKSSKPSVATVDEYGNVTAVKHGSAVISATLDGVTKTCTVTVESPVITLDTQKLTLKKGEQALLTAKVSSGNAPTWTSSNSAVAYVDGSGLITAVDTGKAYIYASEDGTKVRCSIIVK